MLKSLLLTLIALLAVTACGSQAATETSPASTPSPSASPSPPSLASLDPCQLVTAQEASTLAGASYAAGVEKTPSSGTRECVYGGQTLNVFIVIVNVSSDATAAQAAWATAEADAQANLQQFAASQGASITMHAGDITLPGADRAAVATGGGPFEGHTLNVSAIYVLKGAVFFTFSDLLLDKPAPTASAMAGQAATVLTRIP